MTSWLSVTAPLIAAGGALGALLRWYIVDRRKSDIEARLKEEALPADVNLRDSTAADARLIYVQKQMDIERAFHGQQINDRDAEIARQRAELVHRDEIIAGLLRDVARLEAQLAQMGRELTAVHTQLAHLSNHEDPP